MPSLAQDVNDINRHAAGEADCGVLRRRWPSPAVAIDDGRCRAAGRVEAKIASPYQLGDKRRSGGGHPDGISAPRP
jgi:hypothetical protein